MPLTFDALRAMTTVFAVVVFTDHLLQFPLELKHIWRRKCTVISLLYLGTRYIATINFIIQMAFFYTQISSLQCQRFHRVVPILCAAAIACAQMLLLLRCWVLCGRQYSLLLGLLLPAWVAVVVIQAIACARFSALDLTGAVRYRIIPSGGGGDEGAETTTATSETLLTQRICGSAGHGLWLSALWLAPMILDVLLLLLVSLRVLQQRRRRQHQAERTCAAQWIWQQHVGYFAACLLPFLVSAVLVTSSHTVQQSISKPAAGAIATIVATRIVHDLKSRVDEEADVAAAAAVASTVRGDSPLDKADHFTPDQTQQRMIVSTASLTYVDPGTAKVLTSISRRQQHQPILTHPRPMAVVFGGGGGRRRRTQWAGKKLGSSGSSSSLIDAVRARTLLGSAPNRIASNGTLRSSLQQARQTTSLPLFSPLSAGATAVEAEETRETDIDLDLMNPFHRLSTQTRTRWLEADATVCGGGTDGEAAATATTTTTGITVSQQVFSRISEEQGAARGASQALFTTEGPESSMQANDDDEQESFASLPPSVLEKDGGILARRVQRPWSAPQLFPALPPAIEVMVGSGVPSEAEDGGAAVVVGDYQGPFALASTSREHVAAETGGSCGGEAGEEIAAARGTCEKEDPAAPAPPVLTRTRVEGLGLPFLTTPGDAAVYRLRKG